MAIAQQDIEINRAIGSHGSALLAQLYARTGRPVNVLTHCNAGWIATVDYGTALSSVYLAHDAGVPLHVWVDETRPRNQGLLTAWELAGHGVPHTLIAGQCRRPPDAARPGGYRDGLCRPGQRRRRRVQQDRYLPERPWPRAKARFRSTVAVPSLDYRLAVARRTARGADRRTRRFGAAHRAGAGRGRTTHQHRAGPPDLSVANPAFDVTPARLVTGLITERGIVRPAELATLFPEASAKP